MSMHRLKLSILSILSDNLKETEPQLVPSKVIAGRLNLDVSELRPVLKSMEGTGVIETDPDLQYTLITREGLHWYREQGRQR